MFIEKMNIETLNNVIGNTLNRVIEKAIDSIGALPIGSRYSFAKSNPFTLLVQRTAFGDYPEVIFQDIETGKDIVKINDVSKKTKDKLIDALTNHVEKTTVSKIAFEGDYKKDIVRKIKKFSSNIIQELTEEKRGKSKSTKKKTASKSTKKTNRKINPDKAGFLVRKTPSGFVNEPKSKFTIYKNEKLPKLKFFVGKVDNKWQVIELLTGMPLSIQSEVGSTKSDIIKETDEKIEKYGAKTTKELVKNNKLPKDQLDIALMPYKLYSKPKISKTTTPKKQTIKKTVKAKPKKVSSSIETCSDAGRILRIKKSSAAGRKLAICRWN